MNISEQEAAAIDYARQGRRVIPLHTPILSNGAAHCTCGNAECSSIGKHPRTKHGLHDATTDEAVIHTWWAQWPEANVGLLTGDGLLVLDVDGQEGEKSLQRLQDDHETLPATYENITGRGRQLFFTTPPGAELKNTTAKLGEALDTRGAGGYVVVPPSLHYCGVRYKRANSLPMAPAPDWLIELLKKPAAPAPRGRSGHEVKIPQGRRHSHLLTAAGAMRRKGLSTESIEKGLLEENVQRCDPTLPEEEVKRIAQDMGAKPAPLLDTTEDGLALKLVDAHLGDLRYTAPWHRWHRWDGTRWKEDVTVKVFDLARTVCRDAAAGDPKLEKVLKAGHTVASVVGLAATDQRIVMVPEDWDQDKWLLNTPSGLVNLHTGELNTHDPAALITKITEVGPAGECPIWRKQLGLVTAGDRALQEYLQRWAGYSLTGLIKEEALAFFYGTGQNGKDTFITTLQLIVGDYARLAPIKTFTVSKNEQHPTDLAGLRSARLVVASETSGGSRWDEEKIKLLTGGGKVSARFMRADFFDYMPEYKLWIMGNHKPSLRNVDVAMRRRLQLVPFTVQITPVDKNFKASLVPEWPGILKWAIQGCLEWQRRGLDPPSAVVDATEEYFADQDTLGRWLSERCTLEVNAETRSSEAYDDWKVWTEKVKEYTGSQRVFSQRLMEKGFKQKKDGTGKMVFIGIELNHG